MTYEQACVVWTKFSRAYSQFDYGYNAMLKLENDEPVLVLVFYSQESFDRFPYKEPEFQGLRIERTLELQKKARRGV
jgi:hypothetical protein